MSGHKFDDIDLRILKTLQQDGNITNLDLSKKINLSPAPTLERVKRLENTGVIKGYHAEIDPKVMGLTVTTYILITLSWLRGDTTNRFVEMINDLDEITECHHITGSADFLMKVITKDISAYEQLILKKLLPSEEVERLQTLVVLSTAKESKALPEKFMTVK